ncbi:MAG: nickel pincer cofactor biosynthesis protein LarC [Candidatus Bathyarchaeia archaeon]
MKIMIVDCQVAGISGDMIIGALLDAGANVKTVIDAMKTAKKYLKGCQSLEVAVDDVARAEFRGKKVTVRVEDVSNRLATEIKDAVQSCVTELGLSNNARTLALAAVDTLSAAEAKIHGESIEQIDLEEEGAADTVADIVGAVTALDDLNLFENTRIYSTPVAVGGGLFKFSHGTVQSPAPATVEILRSKQFPLVGGQTKSELATPTGVALLVNMIHEVVSFYPEIKPMYVGYGAGAKDFKEIGNVLRVVIGETPDQALSTDKICVLETNLDDVTGEIIGYTINKLMKEGAKDVSVIPITTKKNRPGQIISVMADTGSAERLAQLLINETGTLGVRVFPCNRYILARESATVEVELEGIKEQAKVKIARDSQGNIIQVKPEFDSAERLANKTGKPVKQVIELIAGKARKSLSRA